MYFLPISLAYDFQIPFWELVFCYGSEDEPFELDYKEFNVGKHYVLDRKTFELYLSEACVSGILTQIKNERGEKYCLSVKPELTTSIPKPKNFVLNDWLNKLLTLEPFERRTIWLFNFLMHTRWEKNEYHQIEQLLASLINTPFKYTLPELKNGLDQARGKSTESPKEPLQALWKLGIIRPSNADSFRYPQKDQTWEFYLNLAKFDEEAFKQFDNIFIPVSILDIVCQILYRRRKRIENDGYNPTITPVPFKSEYISEILEKIINEQKLRFPQAVSLKSLVTDFYHELENRNIINFLNETEILLKSARLGNRHEMRPLARQVVGKYFEQIRKRQLEKDMEPFIKYRDKLLGEMVLQIGLECNISSSICMDLFLYLQKNIDHLPHQYYELFKTYCINKYSLLQLGIGFREILDNFKRTHYSAPKANSYNIKRIHKEVVMKDLEKEVLFVLDISHKQINLARLRRILSFSKGSSLDIHEEVILTIELWAEPLQLIHKEHIQVLNLQKEELAPTGNLALKLKGITDPLRAKLKLSRPLAHLIVQIILEIAY